jgi:tetrapyrrole methylase family protein / MazG family protein
MPAAGPPRVVACGLGPGGPDLVTQGVRDAIARVPHRYLRTTRHPSAGVVGQATSFDALYDAADRIDDVYAGIVEALVAAASEHGEVLYAVPGSPVVAERTVELLVADGRVAVEAVPALSFVDLAWVRLGVDPVERGVRLVDGHRFAVAAAGERGPLLVGQCDGRDVLSEIKLAIGEVADAVEVATHSGDDRSDAAEPTVVVLQRLGLPDERIVEVPWHELDRVEPDHLTSVYVPALAAPIAGEVAAFAEVVRRLRADCPWDREQTHQSLRRHLIEEAYEVLEAIDHLDVEAGAGFDALEEELGDLLFQVVFHATLAAEEGRFTLADVARGIATKLIGRHPHVFGDATADSAEEVASRWEQIKKDEKGRASVMDGIPVALPALLFASKVQKKAASQGVDWRTLVADDGTLTETGRRMLAVVDDVRLTGEDPETELRLAAEHVRDRFRAQEEAERHESAG